MAGEEGTNVKGWKEARQWREYELLMVSVAGLLCTYRGNCE